MLKSDDESYVISERVNKSLRSLCAMTLLVAVKDMRSACKNPTLQNISSVPFFNTDTFLTMADELGLSLDRFSTYIHSVLNDERLDRMIRFTGKYEKPNSKWHEEMMMHKSALKKIKEDGFSWEKKRISKTV